MTDKPVSWPMSEKAYLNLNTWSISMSSAASCWAFERRQAPGPLHLVTEPARLNIREVQRQRSFAVLLATCNISESGTWTSSVLTGTMLLKLHIGMEEARKDWWCHKGDFWQQPSVRYCGWEGNNLQWDICNILLSGDITYCQWWQCQWCGYLSKSNTVSTESRMVAPRMAVGCSVHGGGRLQRCLGWKCSGTMATTCPWPS